MTGQCSPGGAAASCTRVQSRRASTSRCGFGLQTRRGLQLDPKLTRKSLISRLGLLLLDVQMPHLVGVVLRAGHRFENFPI